MAEVLKLDKFDPDIAEALRERDITDQRLNSMTPREILDEVLNWEGISGYTGMIIRTLITAGAIIPGE